MFCVDVTVNIPARQLSSSYTYAVPMQWLDEIAVGKRVWVDFRGQGTEGYIISRPRTCEDADIKPLQRILDTAPIFDEHLLHLAQWMSEHYFCPLAVILNLMVPRGLHKNKDQVVMPAIDTHEFERMGTQGQVLNRMLFARLWEQGEISWDEAYKLSEPQELAEYEKQGYIICPEVYRPMKIPKEAAVYSLTRVVPEEELAAIRRRAPRQAQLIELLSVAQDVDGEQLARNSSPHALQALIKKGYIETRPPKPAALKSGWSLSPEQDLAVAQVGKALDTCQYAELLLFGVTGSGKTEVYLRAAELALAAGRGVIVLVPEIALTRQLVEVFAARIDGLAVLHSGMADGERFAEWTRIKEGQARLVLGARSAVFAPVAELGLIIIDEEQEGTFKQEELPRYHAREVAEQRARLAEAVLLAGSATPALETYHKTATGHSKLLVLQERVGGGSLSRITIEDLRLSFKGRRRGMISPHLREKIAMNLSREEQIILFINRRGYAPLTLCWECGQIRLCPTCSVGMTYHRDIGFDVCHYCNRRLPPVNTCAHCGSSHLQHVGSGTQRVEEEIRELFPEARIERLDLDSSRRKGAQQSILNRMKGKEIDILIGTQMIAKGLDFPAVSLVGVVDADAMLNIPDFRSGERCFQLLVQAAGRAGRGEIPGEVVIQTYNPDHPVIIMAAAQDYPSFFAYEIALRKALNYPPFTNLLKIVFTSENETAVIFTAQSILAFTEEIIDASEEEYEILGPAPCPIQKIRSRFRYQLLIKCRSEELLRSIAQHILSQALPKHVKMDLDLNPITTI